MMCLICGNFGITGVAKVVSEFSTKEAYRLASGMDIALSPIAPGRVTRDRQSQDLRSFRETRRRNSSECSGELYIAPWRCWTTPRFRAVLTPRRGAPD